MLKNLSYKKDYWLPAGTILLLLICYQLAFKNTIQAFQARSRLKAQLNQVADVTYDPGYLERKARNLDRLLNRYQTDTLTLRGNTIAQVAMIAEKEGVKLSEVPVEDPAYHTAHFIIQQLEFEGAYSSLVKTLDNLAHNKTIGVLRSVSFRVTNTETADLSRIKIVMTVLVEAKK
ncbi:hypothetical protein ACFGVR_15435 [Mucilaginibacter sp. AW1-3]